MAWFHGKCGVGIAKKMGKTCGKYSKRGKYTCYLTVTCIWWERDQSAGIQVHIEEPRRLRLHRLQGKSNIDAIYKIKFLHLRDLKVLMTPSLDSSGVQK